MTKLMFQVFDVASYTNFDYTNLLIWIINFKNNDSEDKVEIQKYSMVYGDQKGASTDDENDYLIFYFSYYGGECCVESLYWAVECNQRP